MGQLKKDVGSSANGSATGAACGEAASRAGVNRQSDRRFLPPRRRDGRPAAGPPSRENGKGVVSFRATPQSAANGTQGDEAEEIRPGPGADLVGNGERPASLEMAWLWGVSNRMEEEAVEVANFLTRHDLDRYASLLTGPEAPGTSLDALGEIDDAGLAELGLPASPRLRLRLALEKELEAREDNERPNSSASSRPADAETDARRWRRLGFVPKGWARVQPEAPARPSTGSTSVRTRCEPVVLADCGVGDDIAERESDSEQGPFATRVDAVVGEACQPRLPEEQPLQLESLPPTPGGMPAVGSRPSSRPGTSTGRVCCYECYKQVSSQLAVSFNDDALGLTKRFCSEECIDRHRASVALRDARAHELEKIRAAVAARGASAGSDAVEDLEHIADD